ncbi:hypothetical protein P261_01362 [Lachnospiraceae bacterium TWA4]|nr:hypothetical protein P261_01362 [Lachnospiraceae bacterium TWA4]
MKLALYPKVLVGYLLFGILGFTLISTFSSNLVYSYLISKNAESLYTQATKLSNQVTDYYSEDMVDLSTLSSELSSLSKWMDSNIWIMNKEGLIIYDSTGEHKNHKIEAFETTQQYFCTGTFYNEFSEDYLSVIAPINVDYSIRGYILFHSPISIILEEQYHVLNLIYISSALIFVLSLIILIVFQFVVYLPIKKSQKLLQLMLKVI